MPTDFGEVICTQIHQLGDGSMIGYGQCSYLRMINKEGRVHYCLLMGKARVATIKQVTVPRLKLVVYSVKFANFLEQELKLGNIQHHFWTDSELVLSYINNEAKRFHVFAASPEDQRPYFATSMEACER